MKSDVGERQGRLRTERARECQAQPRERRRADEERATNAAGEASGPGRQPKTTAASVTSTATTATSTITTVASFATIDQVRPAAIPRAA